MSLFVDTSAFIALLVPEDENHGGLLEALRRADEAGEELVTTNYVVVETCALLRSRFGSVAVRRFLEDVAPGVMIEWVDVDLHTQGASSTVMFGRKGPSLVDCVSFAAMRKLRIRHALSFDRHFHEHGFEKP